MPLREHVPTALHGVARQAYLKLSVATSTLRMLPDFIVIGGQRCGTTSLFKNLAEHPQVIRPAVDKGIDYFTLNYSRDLDWYRGQFPLASLAQRHTSRFGGPVVFEACTYYMFHPFALERIARDLPSVKLIAMLRDPVQRAFSAYKHEFARGFETVGDFATALGLEDERLVGEEARMRDDLTYESLAHRHHAYRLRGQYVDQLKRAFELFPRDQVHVVDSESYFAEPDTEYRRIIEFLGLSDYQPKRFDQHNARPSSAMPGNTRELLEVHYAPYDTALAELLGRQPRWMSS